MKPLSEYLHPAWVFARTLPDHDGIDARMRTALIAQATWGVEAVQRNWPLLAIAALADALRTRMVVHQLRLETCDIVGATDLHSQLERPALMRGPWVVECADMAHPLPGGLISAGAYALDGRTFAIALTASGGAYSGEVTVDWDQAGQVSAHDNGAEEIGLMGAARERWAEPLSQGIRTAIVLGLLLDADKSPVTSSDVPREARKQASRPERREALAWVIRSCSLRANALRGPAAIHGEGTPLDTRGLALVDATVTGHLKRQPYGPGGRDRRWTWIESYEARRWVAPAAKIRV